MTRSLEEISRFLLTHKYEFIEYLSDHDILFQKV